MPPDPDFLRTATNGRRAVARLPGPAAQALDTCASIVQISGQPAAKQRERHDFNPEDYVLLQRILNEGDLFQIDDRNIAGFVERDGKLWRAVVNTTRDREELFLTILHRVKPRDLRIESSEMKRVSARSEEEG